MPSSDEIKFNVKDEDNEKTHADEFESLDFLDFCPLQRFD
jgi:hypothetical protein